MRALRRREHPLILARNSSSLRQNLGVSSLISRKDLQYKLIVHPHLNVRNDEPKSTRTEPYILHYRGTSLIRNSAPLGPYSRNMPRALGGGGGSYERGTPVEGSTMNAPPAITKCHICKLTRLLWKLTTLHHITTS